MLTAQEQEFLNIYREADDDSKVFIIEMLFCFAYCGETFFTEFQQFHQNGDHAGVKSVVKKYVSLAKEGVAV